MQTTVQEAFAVAARFAAAGRPVDARAIYEQILAAVPEHPGALLRIAEQDLAVGGAGLEAARVLLARALRAANEQALPANEILLALGKAQKAAGSLAQARATLEQCATLTPDDARVLTALGATCLDANDARAARRHFERAIELGTNSGELWDNLGLACRALGDEPAGEAAFERALAVAPGLTPALANLVQARQYLCAWDTLEASEAKLVATLTDPAADPRWPPFVALGMPITAMQQLDVARRWSRSMLPAPAPRWRPPPRGRRLRVGYLSGSFHEHPTARLMAGLFEEHDGERFEIVGYSYGPDDGSALRARVSAAFDRWRDLRDSSDDDIAAAIRGDAIDLLIERKGHTHGGRMGILASRPAPVQIHYMSFPGTIGYDAIDGIIADAQVVPPGTEADFHERVWRLPRCYYVNDGRREPPATASRRDHELPEDALVLACLNQPYKLRRAFFIVWMEALRARPDAILWLLAAHPQAQANLRIEAAKRGVDPARLIFARRAPQQAHLDRVACADLALDTLPYGAHTTGVDALWAGVPMLTCRGDTFAGRVGASLLKEAGLPDLIAESIDDYRTRLLSLVADRAALLRYRDHLIASRATNPLFDTAAFARDWESLLLAIYDAAIAGA